MAIKWRQLHKFVPFSPALSSQNTISDQGTHFPIPLYRHQGTFSLFEVQCSQSFSKVCCKFRIPYPIQSNYNPLSLCTLPFENSLPNQPSEKNDKRTMIIALWSCSASTHSARPRKPLTKRFWTTRVRTSLSFLPSPASSANVQGKVIQQNCCKVFHLHSNNQRYPLLFSLK